MKHPSVMPLPESDPSPGEAAASTAQGFQHTLIVLRSHLLVATALMLVAATLTAWQQMRRTKLYTAQATLFLEKSESRVEGTTDWDYYQTDVSLMTRIEQIKGIEMAQRVAASLTPEEKNLLLSPGAGQQAPSASATPLEHVVHGAMGFERPRNTMLLSITATTRNPKASALLANRYAELFVRYIFERSNAANDASLGFLRDQAEQLRKKAEDAERKLQDYRQKYTLVSLEANQNIIVDNLKSLNASATTARLARITIEARLAQAEAVVKRGGDSAQLAAITGSDSLVDITRRLADLRGKRAVMAERYGRRHPAMEENQRSIAALEKARDEQVESVLASLRDQREKSLAEEKQLAEQLAKAEKAALNLDQLGVEYSILRSTVESHKATYAQTMTRLNDATTTAQLRGVNLKISSLATPPGAPSSPNLSTTILVTLAVALTVFFGYPFGAEILFGRIRSSFDVEYFLRTAVLGEIGSVRDVPEKDRPFLVKSEVDEGASEQFRALYAQLKLNSKIDPPKTLVVTSTVPGEGKSFVAANLAACFVAHGHRTLVIDGDLRRPKQHRQYGLPSDRGIMRWLNAGGKLDGDLLTDDNLRIAEVQPGLFVLSAGGISRKGTELMEGAHLSGLLAALQQKFDVVIIDTPPVGIFPDALAFAKVSHELIYVCRFNAVSRNAVREVISRLQQTGLEFPGIVLNAMPTGFGSGYYYKGYGYNSSKYYSKHYKQDEETS